MAADEVVKPRRAALVGNVRSFTPAESAISSAAIWLMLPGPDEA